MKTILNNRSNKPLMLAVIFAVVLLFTGCQGEEGPMGRSGPVGPKGDTGANGIANVSTAIYDVAPSDWTGNADGFKTTLTIPELNDAIYTHGAVLIYELMDENTADKSFHLLPYTEVISNSFTYLDFDAYIGKITIKLRWTDNGVNTTNAPTSNYAFKIVLIEGTPLGSLKENVNISDLNAVLTYASANKLNYKTY
jgi:hypothetical protein